MTNSAPRSAWARWRLGTRLSLGAFALILLGAGLLVLAVNTMVTRFFEERAVAHVHDQTELLAQVVETADKDLRKQADQLALSLQEYLTGTFTVSTAKVDVRGRNTPELLLNGHRVNLDFDKIDRYTQLTGAVATVFVRDGADFVRIATSLKNDKGERAVGTLLAHDHPGYPLVMSGRPYTGLATLFGRSYMTRYDPIQDDKGQVIAVSFVGVDFSERLDNLKQMVRGLKIGSSGYFYVLDTRPGANQGQLIVHPTAEGKNLMAQKDAQGREFVKEMVATGSGLIRYPWLNAERGETAPREKMVAFHTFPGWSWLIAGGAYVDEYTQEVVQMRRMLVALGCALAVVVGGATFVLIGRLVSRPLAQAQAAAQAIAAGDLSAQLCSERHDEIGMLMNSIDEIAHGLGRVVRSVRENSEAVANACGEIAQGNQDLSARTESQSSTLQETSAAMSALGDTVRTNADHARQANQLAVDASGVAREGGSVVAKVVVTMSDIEASSRRISDIIGVIDGISFQTNILALNAAVEAARAGESGRGFAVVAGEVRSLAGRSAEAAREVRTLITDSVERVQQGSALVDQAGATMDRIVDSVRRVSEIMEDICAASAEQTDGVQQVGQSVQEIEHGTQQNAALVEQVAAAASSLRHQADELVRSVAVFQTDKAS